MDLLQIMEEENSSFQKFNIALKLLEVSCYFYYEKIFPALPKQLWALLKIACFLSSLVDLYSREEMPKQSLFWPILAKILQVL